MLFAGLFAQFAASPLGDTSPPGGEEWFATELPLGARIDIDSNGFLVPLYSLGHCLMVVWYLLGNVAACLEDCLAFAWSSFGIAWDPPWKGEWALHA